MVNWWSFGGTKEVIKGLGAAVPSRTVVEQPRPLRRDSQVDRQRRVVHVEMVKLRPTKREYAIRKGKIRTSK